MSDPIAAEPARNIPAVLDAGTQFEGLVAFEGAVRVEGLVIGDVVALGCLILGEQGELRGRVEADEVIVEGSCEGEIEARLRIELRPTARVRGRMKAARVVMADGSVFDGECEMGLAPLRVAEEVPMAPLEAPLTRETASISA